MDCGPRDCMKGRGMAWSCRTQDNRCIRACMYSYAMLRIRNVTYTLFLFLLFPLAGAFPTHRDTPSLSLPLYLPLPLSPRTHITNFDAFPGRTVERAREKFMCNLRKIMIIFYFMAERTRSSLLRTSCPSALLSRYVAARLP